MTARPQSATHDFPQALQRLNDSLQVLVLLLSRAEAECDGGLSLVTAAAKRALEDVAMFRACFLGQERP